jgi:ribosomal 50S subunit-associated protein YjgA (DUF615 family)
MSIIDDFVQLHTIKRFSPQSVKNYANAITQFINAFPERDLRDISQQET